jgi:hypothetical protein
VVWRPPSAKLDPRLRGSQVSAFERPIFDRFRVWDRLFNIGVGESFAKNLWVFEVEASRFADSGCPFVLASFSPARRLSSSRSFGFRLALFEDVPCLSRRMPAERLMRSVLVVRIR